MKNRNFAVMMLCLVVIAFFLFSCRKETTSNKPVKEKMWRVEAHKDDGTIIFSNQVRK